MTMKPLEHVAITVFVIPTFLLCGQRSAAQGRKAGDLPPVTAADFTVPTSPVIDTGTAAVILADAGEIHFIGNNKGWFSHVYTVHERIKVLNKKAFDAATVRIMLYDPPGDPEKLDKVSASTFNLENGRLTEVKVGKKDFFEDRINKDYKVVKWTLP